MEIKIDLEMSFISIILIYNSKTKIQQATQNTKVIFIQSLRENNEGTFKYI